MEALSAAMRDLKEGHLDAIVTAPSTRETVQADDFRYTGHTEYLAAELGGEAMMIMCSDVLRVGLVTKHIPVSEIARSITKERIVKELHTLRRSLVEDFGIVEPRIAVMALNPHAGDGGLLGREEQEIIKPAIVEAFGEGVLAFRALCGRRALRRRRIRQIRRHSGHVPRSGARAVQDALARRGELHGGAFGRADLARPRHGVRHRRKGQGRPAVDAQRDLRGHRHRGAPLRMGRMDGESVAARRTRKRRPRCFGQDLPQTEKEN